MKIVQSILSKVSKTDIISEPFPHIVIQNALDSDLYDQLSKEYPGSELLASNKNIVSNTRYQISAHEAIGNNQISPVWQDFISHHVSHEFYQEVIDLFGSHIRALYPWLEESLGRNLEDLSTGIRRKDPGKDVVLDCQPGVNSPVSTPTSVRGPHVDSPGELYAALLYMRDENDDSVGGDLDIYRIKDPNHVFHGAAELKDQYIEKVKTVKYEKNVLVFFINTPHSVHGVSVRSVTRSPRRLVNVIGETWNLPNEKRLFSLRRESKKRSLSWLGFR
jgi:hypothetical protein